jgi:OmpA-OmpF porin, OOP family
MSKQTTYLLGILATILLGSWLYSKHCCSCNDTKPENTTVASNNESDIGNSFTLSGGGFEYSCEKNFNFLNETFNFIKPIDKCVDEGLGKLKTFFDKNPNGKLTITGYCLSSEKNTSAFPNLGFARANDVKNYFISKGFPANRFDINGEIKESWVNNNGTLLGPVSYSVTNDIVEAKGEDWNVLKEKITANPLVLYFNTNQTEISLTEEERQKVADLNRYLDHVTEAKISCVGHTDNVGDRNVNIQLGQGRANFAKEYLSKNGILSDRIEATSKGPDEPIADNLTPEGKAKNRRTVITLK